MSELFASCFFFRSTKRSRARLLFVFAADCKSRAEAFPPGSSHRFCSLTAAINAIDIMWLVSGNGEEGEREIKEKRSGNGHVEMAQTAAFFSRAKKKSDERRNRHPAFRAPARRRSAVSALCASTQGCARDQNVPLCGELEECAGA